MHSRSRPGLELEHAGGKAETDFFAWTLKDDFSLSETQALCALAKWGWTQLQPSPVIALTGQELLAGAQVPHVIDAAWEYEVVERAARRVSQGNSVLRASVINSN